MAYFADDEIDGMLAAWGNRITVSGTIRPCILDERDELGAEGDGFGPQIKRMLVATIKSTHFPDIAPGDEVSIDGIRYTVRSLMKLSDGAITELFLRVVEP